MEDECKVSRAFRCQHTRRREAWIADERRIAVARPLDAIRRIRHHHVKRLLVKVPLVRFYQRVAERNVELVRIDVVQEHVHAAELVDRRLLLLSEEPAQHLVLAEHLRDLHQERPRTARGIVCLVDAPLAPGRDHRQETGRFLRREELAAGLPRVRGVHLHQVLVSVAKGINRVVLEVPELHFRDAGEEVDQLPVPLVYRRAEVLQALEVHAGEKPLEVLLAFRPVRRRFDLREDLPKRDVEVRIVLRASMNVAEEVRR